MYAIETNIPIPGPAANSTKYPWEGMVPGSSFFVPGDTSNRIAAAAFRAAKHRGWQVTVRKVDGGIRVWRIA